MVEYLTTFLAGLFLEGTAVFWTHYLERGRALIAASLSTDGEFEFTEWDRVPSKQ